MGGSSTASTTPSGNRRAHAARSAGSSDTSSTAIGLVTAASRAGARCTPPPARTEPCGYLLRHGRAVKPRRQRSPDLTITTPSSTSAPPSSWIERGACPSSTHANPSAASTSVRATKEASREPSRRRGGDARDVGERGRHHAQAQHRQPPGHGDAAEVHGGRRRREGQHADRAQRAAAPTPPTVRPAAASTTGGRPCVLGGDQEVGGDADHRAERPDDADAVDVGARDEVQHQHQADDREQRAGDRARPGALAAGEPEPADDGHRRHVLDQQRRPRPASAPPR